MTWPNHPIGKVILSSQYGLSIPAHSEGHIPIVGMKGIQGGRVHIDDTICVSLSDEELDTYRIRKGDILLNRTNSPDLVGKTGLALEDMDAVFASYLVRIMIDKSKADPEFINYCMNSEAGQRQMKTLSTRAISQANINPTTFKQHFRIPLPPIAVQHGIASFIRSWDTAIEKMERLIAAKTNYNIDLKYKLLFGKVRLGRRITKGFLAKPWFFVPNDWQIVAIGSTAKEVSTKNKDSDDIPVLSCTKYQGLVDSLKYFDKQIFSKDTSTYKIVEHGHFAYATNHIEEGSIGYQNLYPKGLVSPMYTVFEANQQRINDGYLYKLLKTETYRHIFQVNTSASVDRRGSLRWNGFAKLPIPLPSLDEQKEINEAIETAQKEIDLLTRKIDLLKKQKNGLMRKLLTGEWRVKTAGEVL